jgi:hypothetical protein
VKNARKRSEKTSRARTYRNMTCREGVGSDQGSVDGLQLDGHPTHHPSQPRQVLVTRANQSRQEVGTGKVHEKIRIECFHETGAAFDECEQSDRVADTAYREGRKRWRT